MGSHSNSGQSEGKVARAAIAALERLERYGWGRDSQP